MAEDELVVIEIPCDEMKPWVEFLSALFELHYVGGTNATTMDDFFRGQRGRQREWRTLQVIKFHRSDNARKDRDDLLACGGELGMDMRPWNSCKENDDLKAAGGFVYVRSYFAGAK